VRKQAELGVDVVDDGEMGKPASFRTSTSACRVRARPAGPDQPVEQLARGGAFPEFYEWFARAMPSPAVRSMHMVCTGPIVYKGHQHVQADIENLKASLGATSTQEALIPAISPTSIEDWQRNAYYKTDEEYLAAIAEAMHEEYKAIVDAGFLLQIDDPHLATHYVSRPDLSVDQVRRWAEVRVEVLNHALRGLPRDRIRWHTCYGINIGPRVHDLELKHFVDVMLKIRAGAYSFEAANPRHEHEWRVWENVKLPEGAVLIPGTITQSTVLVEHPELVADRIGRFARAVGRENVIAGADCGFATFAGSTEIHPSVCGRSSRRSSKARVSRPGSSGEELTMAERPDLLPRSGATTSAGVPCRRVARRSRSSATTRTPAAPLRSCDSTPARAFQLTTTRPARRSSSSRATCTWAAST
jgi:5-methyltetrahydropteroyltriglutamate--homocysteine methyltransferase